MAMLQDVRDQPRLRFFELLFSRLRDPELQLMLYSGLSNSDAVKEAGGIDAFIGILKRTSPILYPVVDRLSWLYTMRSSSQNLDRGFGGAADEFLTSLSRVFEIGEPRDIEAAVSHLDGKISEAMAGTFWSELRNLPDLVTNSTLVKAIADSRPKLSPELSQKVEKLLTDIEVVRKSRAQLRAKAANEVKICVDGALRTLGLSGDGSKPLPK